MRPTPECRICRTAVIGAVTAPGAVGTRSKHRLATIWIDGPDVDIILIAVGEPPR